MIKTLVTGAALALLVAAGSAQAAPRAAVASAPKQPIPYAKLDAYLAASPKARASTDWWAGSDMASTGLSTDTAASLPAASTSAPTMTGAAASSVDNAAGASQFSGATMTTTTSGATPGQGKPH